MLSHNMEEGWLGYLKPADGENKDSQTLIIQALMLISQPNNDTKRHTKVKEKHPSRPDCLVGLARSWIAR